MAEQTVGLIQFKEIKDMEEIQKFYTEDCNESQRLISQSGQIEYITTMKYLEKYCRQNMSVLDACAGCGIYSFPIADLKWRNIHNCICKSMCKLHGTF